MESIAIDVGSLVVSGLAGLCVGTVYGIIEGQKLFEGFASEMKDGLKNPVVTVRVKKVKTKKKFGKGIGAMIPGKLHHHGVHANEL